MGKEFDDLAKALARGESRRQALRKFVVGALGAVVGAAMPASASADGIDTGCKPGGKACKHNQECCSGSCCNGACCPAGESCCNGVCCPNGFCMKSNSGHLVCMA
jgi:hypothetical protein